jgi:aspartate carbamoyltransferase catalytic subunit
MRRMTVATWNRRHLLGLEGLSGDDLDTLIQAAVRHLDVANGTAPPLGILEGKIIANLFFEDSTRTRCSFTVAARRLGADVLDLTGAGSSVSKGETLIDTALTIEAMGVDLIVTRTKPSGGPTMIADAVNVPVINAGDGRHEHPTQGLLDLLTMRQHLGELAGKTIGIVGDIASSRVARSNIHALTTIGANVVLVGPPALVPDTLSQIASGPGSVEVGHDLDSVLGDLDIVMMLRVQFERQSGGVIGEDYREQFGLTVERARRLKAETAIMHPGPMNRGLEIDSEVADDDSRSLIRRQVTNGVAVRMAVLEMLLLG